MHTIRSRHASMVPRGGFWREDDTLVAGVFSEEVEQEKMAKATGGTFTKGETGAPSTVLVAVEKLVDSLRSKSWDFQRPSRRSSEAERKQLLVRCFRQQLANDS